eukprot:Skav201544  [mRNA]  locus=scaffold1616:149307:151070:+ [translate_table: standard]
MEAEERALQAICTASRSRKAGTLRGFPVTDQDRQRCNSDVMLDFERRGFLKVPGILTEDEVAAINEVIEELRSIWGQIIIQTVAFRG